MGTFHDLPPDAFRLTEKKFSLPAETSHLGSKLKREITICNLFANHHLSATDIIRILDETYENVVLSLIKHQVVHDRRQQAGAPPTQTERRRTKKKVKPRTHS